MKKESLIFIAGSSGLVGSSISQVLKENGYMNVLRPTHSELDLLNPTSVETFFAKHKIEYVFFCAAKVGGIMANNTYRADFIYENLAMQNHIIYNAYKYNVKKLLFLGSSCIYPKNATQPINENALLTSELEYTNEPYAIAKIAGLKMCESFALQYNSDFIAVMPTNLYGNNDNFDLYTSHVLPALIRKIHLGHLLEMNDLKAVEFDTGLKGRELEVFLDKFGISSKRISVWGDGTPRREFLHTLDMARACVFIMEHITFKDLVRLNADSSDEIRNTHINIGYGSDISIAELAMLIKRIVGFGGELFFDTSKPNGTFQKLMDCAKLNALGYQPQITLENGISSVYKHYCQSLTKRRVYE